MNVIVITPLYYIKNRPKLFHDSNCIHYLLKYWPKDTNIYVFHEYHSWAKHWKRLLDAKERNYFKNGYYFEEDGIKVSLIEIPIFPKQKHLLRFQKKKISTFINNFLEANNVTPDIAIFHQPSYYCGQYMGDIEINCPKIGILHYSDVIENRRNKSFHCQLNTFDKLYARSTYIRDYFNKQNSASVEKKIIFSGAPIPSKALKRKFTADAKVNILFVGKLIKRKNADILIKAIAKIGKEKINKLTIIGEGKELKRIKKLTNHLSISDIVEFIPKVSREKVLEYMDNNEIFAMPSTGETVGLVYLEAMSRGCLTIGTQNEGIDGIIQNGKNGFLVYPNDEKSLTNTIDKILHLTNKELDSISTEAIKTAKLFSEKNMSEKYYKIIKENLSKKKNNV